MGLLEKVIIPGVFICFLVWNVSANQTTIQAPSSSTLGAIIPTFELPSNLTLRKCRCQANQEVHGSVCVDQETHIPVMDMALGQEAYFGSSDFPFVTVGDVQCPPGLTKGILFSFVDYMFLLTTGELYWDYGQMFIRDYCVEHVPGGWAASACLEPPPVPRCCPPGHVLGSEDTCVESSSSVSFAPPLTHNSNIMEEVEIEYSEVRDINCSGLAVKRRVTLGNGGDLQYGPRQAVLTYKAPSYSPYVEPEEEYCVGIKESANGSPQYVADFCYVDLKEKHYHTCRNFTCVRKCCPEHQFLYEGNCIDLSENEVAWKPLFHNRNTLQPGAEAPEDLLIVSSLPFCASFYELKPHLFDYDKTYLLRDGTLHNPADRDFPPDSYCLDAVLGENGAMGKIAIVCAPEEQCEWKGTLDIILLSLSCVFLVATLAVYLGVADLRDRTNGRCLISMIAAMLATYVSLIVNNRTKNLSDLQCLLTGFFGHVFGLAMFFWLNVMCYDMWSTLRSSRKQHQSKKTFIFYSIYAWGIPLVIGITARIIDSVQPAHFILPNFLEDHRCWFRDDPEYWLYLSGITVILLLANLFFFIHVAITLARKLRQRQSVFDNSNSRSSNSNKTKQQAWLYVKLFIVMGVVWIADVSSSITHRNTCSFWVITDIINGLQGVFIFLVAVCNRDNLKKFRTAWNPRVESVRTKISTMRGRPTIHNRRPTNVSLATSETSRKTSVTSLPRKISTTSVPQHYAAATKEPRHSELNVGSEVFSNSKSSPPSRKVSLASNLETIPMNPIEE